MKYSVIMNENYGWIKEPTGESLTKQEFMNVLTNVESFRIRGDLWVYNEYGSGQEVTYLNKVVIKTNR